MKPRTIAVVGSANIDLVTRVPRCPKAGESLIGSSFSIVPGGKGANQAVACARLDATTHFVGCVGLDEFGARLSSTLQSAGVSVDYLQRHETEPTGVAIILVADDGTNTIAVTPGANRAISAADIEQARPVLQKADALLVQLEISLEATEAALRMADELDVLTVLDAGPAQPLPLEMARLARVVSPNETEAEAITGIAVHSVGDAEAAAHALRGMGARDVVMKLGERGSLHVGPDGTTHVPAWPVEVVDSVAAGDAFTAALASVWGAMPIRDALRYANAAGALAATRPGAQDAMPTKRDVERLMQEHAVHG